MLGEIKELRSDCSTGPDSIPAKFDKLVAEHLVSPLTHIINSCLDRNEYPLLWKTVRISPIPKVDEPHTNDDYQPISILPVLCKVMRNWLSAKLLIFLRRMSSYNLTSLRARGADFQVGGLMRTH